jgi:hypothetical protein
MVNARRMRSGSLAGLVMIAAVLAAGCAGSSQTPQIIYITPAPGTLAPGASPTPTPAPPTIDSTIVSQTAPDSRWTVVFKKPVVLGTAADTKVNDAIGTKVNGYISAFTSGNLPAVAGGMGPSTLDGNFTIATNNSNVVSLRFTILTYTSGAASAASQAGSINILVSTGATIALADLFTDPAQALPVLTARTKAALAGSLGADLQWPSGAIAMPFFEKAWTMTQNGLEFTFSQGEVASQAAGTPNATVGWSDLKSLLKPKGPAASFIK